MSWRTVEAERRRRNTQTGNSVIMRGWALVWQHWKLSVCLLVSPTVQCACETSTLCHHCFLFVCACVCSCKSSDGEGRADKGKKKKCKNVKHEEERVRVTAAVWYTAASLALTMHCVEECVFICSSGGLWAWCYELGGELSWVCQQMFRWITHAEIKPDER